MKRIFTRPFLVFGLLCMVLNAGLHAQSSGPYSDPAAPVGDPRLTVPEEVVPLMDFWMRDTYVMQGPDGKYYMTGTTATPGRQFPGGRVHCWDWNDGIYLWRSDDLKQWQPMGLVWGFDRDGAAWQKKGKPIKAGALSPNRDPLDSFYRAAWAPEIHYIKSAKKWMMVACINGGAGSFVMESTSGKPEGPYRNIAGNAQGPIFPNIDGSLFEDDNGQVYFIGHNHYIARMKPDLSGLAEPLKLFKETPYNPDPYLEGVYVTKHNGKYQLMQTAWSIKQPDGSYSYIRKEKGNDASLLQSYDVIVAEADNIYGPYGPRYPAIIQGGHNNLFQDKKGNWWSTTFFNPRGHMGEVYKVTCRPGLVPVKWEQGKLQPDAERAKIFYKGFAMRSNIKSDLHEMGANFNHNPEIIDIGYLKRTPIQWIRTTPYAFEYIRGERNPETEPGLQKLIDAAKAGYHVAFGMRWDFRRYNLRMPKPGSAEETQYFDIARRLLNRVGPYLDIYALGNEPNLETMPEDMQYDAQHKVPLLVFTERLMTQVVLPWYAAHPQYKQPDIYTGSLPQLFMPAQQQNPGTVGLIKMAQDDPRITGLAVHLHIADSTEMEKALEFARSIMPDKPIIVPEFSLFRLYNQHNLDLVGDTEQGRAFAAKYHRDPAQKLCDYYAEVNSQQVSSQEWLDFFASRSWFPQHFMQTYGRYFERYGVALGTYGYFSQSAPKKGAPDMPTWFINPIFPQQSLKRQADGAVAPNPLWYDDFVNLAAKGAAERADN